MKDFKDAPCDLETFSWWDGGKRHSITRAIPVVTPAKPQQLPIHEHECHSCGLMFLPGVDNEQTYFDQGEYFTVLICDDCLRSSQG
jgi:hypothetical protein